jgi:hypothetical protein
MDITTNIQIIKKVSYPQEAPTDFGQVGVAEMLETVSDRLSLVNILSTHFDCSNRTIAV